MMALTSTRIHSVCDGSDTDDIRDRIDQSEDGQDRRKDPPPPYSPIKESPPHYASLFTKIETARAEESNHVSLFYRLIAMFFNTVGCTILLVILMSIPLTMIIMGAIFFQACPVQPYIPIYLIVGGIFGLLKNVTLIVENIVKRFKKNHPTESTGDQSSQRRNIRIVCLWRLVNFAFNLLMVIWIIVGSVWVFGAYEQLNTSQGYQGSFCNEILYKFAFGVITTGYILFVMMLVFACFVAICICCKCCPLLRYNSSQDSDNDDDAITERGEM